MNTKTDKKTPFFLRIPVLWCAFFCAAVGACGFRAFRLFWVFYDLNTFFLGGAKGLFVISIAVSALAAAVLALRLYVPAVKGKPTENSKVLCVLGGVAFVLGVIFFVADIVLFILSGAEAAQPIFLNFKMDLPFTAPVLAVAVAVLALPRLKGKGRAVLALCMAACILASSLWALFPMHTYRFVSDPVVMDTGEDYAVVFATNQKGTGFVHYTYGGKTYTVYAQTHGRRIGDRLIHSVHIPYAHLKGNRYTVGSTRVIEEYGYGSRLGGTITSPAYTLQVNEGDTQKYLVISDWHARLKEAKAAVSRLGEYDAVVMLGDPAGSMDYEEQAVQNVVRFGGDLTGGAMPVIYVRGNHETRGAFAADFPASIGYERLYYTVGRGDYHFLVLDSGEDKEDTHIEYGGMTDYTHNRLDMLNWLREQKPLGNKTVVFSHAWQVCEPEEEAAESLAAWNEMDRLGARFLISGHTHTCEVLSKENAQAAPYLAAHPSMTAYIDGGITKEGGYIASKLTLTPQSVQIEAADDVGNKVVNEMFSW